MVREDILGGLNSALARGQSLKQAMMSFYNAGYQKQDIEEAARFLNSGSFEAQTSQTGQQPLQVMQKSQMQKKPLEVKQNISSYGVSKPQQIQTQRTEVEQKPVFVQSVSSYGNERQNPKGKLLIAVLGVILFFLLVSFAAVFFFRQEIIAFFSTS